MATEYASYYCFGDWTLRKGRSDFKGGTKGMLSGKELVQLQLDVWRSFNVSHPRFFQAMPVPACLEGMFNEKVAGKGSLHDFTYVFARV
jgi:hypothetical protein